MPSFTMSNIFLVMTAGSLGALARYGVGLAARSLLPPTFPFGTLIVNVTGCLIIGFVMQICPDERFISKPAKLFLATGFLGAFTTFSTFGYETFGMMRDGQWLLATANAAANLILGLLAVWCGLILARWVSP